MLEPPAPVYAVPWVDDSAEGRQSDAERGYHRNLQEISQVQLAHGRQEATFIEPYVLVAAQAETGPDAREGKRRRGRAKERGLTVPATCTCCDLGRGREPVVNHGAAIVSVDSGRS
ncbi:expressed unknown protein [Ectocarpus siliculosus]|uniref:Uncharacterized protein n=1 Tax=Ectocarpus siliculosus TaxID=2880 RepID=D7G8T3_ECTSI|nr:expressed unknown protein [Ectocarpus siliculosus]|eukprot:CBJ34062.1 expressed unknown protein [Ectocarpus siliculosus]